MTRTPVYRNTPSWDNLPGRMAARIIQVPGSASDCHLWTGSVDHGDRPIINITPSEKNRPAANAAWILSGRELPAGYQSRPTLCQNPLCVNPDHMTLVRSYSSPLHKRARGERCRTAVLTADQVRAILRDPRGNGEIAKDYPCTAENIWAIKLRKSWKHISIED
jgi:hypothetical protein